MLRILVVVVVTVLGALDCAAAVLHHELSILLDPQNRRLHVTDRISVPAGQELALRLAARFRVEQLVLDGHAIAPVRDAADASAWLLKARAPRDRAAVLEVRYAGELDAIERALDHRQVLGLSRPMAGGEDAFLPANTGWYPDGERDLLTYRMKVTVPAGIRPVAAGDVLSESVTASGFEAHFAAREPLPGIDLIAGPYTVSERIVSLAPQREVRVRTYFHQELVELAPSYLESAAGYLRRFNASIGPYAHVAYSIVSSPLPTGFGMPGIAYLGKQVLRLPFIRATSLGHEVLHDWWGNGVYPDYARGNWSEGLTTFLADYAFKEDESEDDARAMRLAWLRDFAAVSAEQDRPLSAFVARRHGADQVVGYGKAAFVFFMLRDWISEERFRAGLRRFWTDHRSGVASWDDLRQAFEAAAGRDLRFFFMQWVTRAGAPRIEITSARREPTAAAHRLVVELRQHGTPFRLNVPLRVHLADGATFDALASIADAQTRLTIDLPQRPHSLTVDPDARIFRRLERHEIAPVLRELMLDRRTTLVVAGHEATRRTAHALASAMLEHVPPEWIDASIERAPPLLIVGLHSEVEEFLARHRLPGLPSDLKARGAALAYAGRGPSGNVYVVVSARDEDALGALGRALPHLGAQSFVVFAPGGRIVERGVWPIEPRRYPISE